jgi:hypothetical protein
MLRYEILRNGKYLAGASSSTKNGEKEVLLSYLKLLATDAKQASDVRATLDQIGFPEDIFAEKFESKVGDTFELTIWGLIPQPNGQQASEGPQERFCSFCSKSQHEVTKLIAASGIFICDQCTELCYDIIQDEKRKDAAAP